MLQTKFPFTQGMFQPCIKQPWANHITSLLTPRWVGKVCPLTSRSDYNTVPPEVSNMGETHFLITPNVNVNVNPVCSIGQPVSGTGGKLWNYFLFTSTLAKFTKKNTRRFDRQNSTSIAEISHEGKFLQRQKFVKKNIKISQKYYCGRPLRLCPCGCQAKTFLIQRCPGSVAKYCAKFQWCRRQISDHDLDPVCDVKARTRSFQMWGILWRGKSIPYCEEAPPLDRRSRRYATSILRKSLR